MYHVSAQGVDESMVIINPSKKNTLVSIVVTETIQN